MMQEPPASNLQPYTVSELSGALRRTIEGAFGMVRVRGELSQVKRHATSGHWYFGLKDENACIDGVMWKSTAQRLTVRPEDGLEVIITGKLTTYARSSRYQIVVEAIELAGEGALLKLLEERKKRLAAEGLFDGARKRPLPTLPSVIGVVTSPSGAVIRDILHRLDDRFPRRVLVWPVAVQGPGAAEQIAAAIEGFNRLAPDGPVPRPDVLIVGRGGGSLEDLMAFNEEIVVRAAAASAIPLISAVGHETDTTLIDFASDRRAPTPTAAAEFAVPVRAELLARVRDADARLVACMSRDVEQRRTHLTALARGLLHPRQAIEQAEQRTDELTERLARGMTATVERRRRDLDALRHRLRAPHALREEKTRALDTQIHRLVRAMERTIDRDTARLTRLGDLLESYSYRGVLRRGFALVTDAAHHPVTSAADARGALTIEFQDGKVSVVAGPPPRKSKGGEDPKQGALL